MVPLVSNCTDAPNRPAVPLRDFLAIPMSGNCCRPAAAVLVNGQTVSACSVGRSVVGCVGFGTRRTTCGRRCIRSISDAGCMSMHAKRLGTSHGSILKVGYPYHTVDVGMGADLSRMGPQNRILRGVFDRWRDRCHQEICSKPNQTRGTPEPCA